jgi:hypothetical protein
MSKRVWCAIVLLATLGGSIAHGEGPADLAVVYRWSNGTVAPKYFYRAEITIRSTGQSSFGVDLGTAPTAHRNLTVPFTPDVKLCDDLWNFIRSRQLDSHVGVAESAPGAARRTAPGAGECELIVLTHGDRVEVPCAQQAAGSLKTMIRSMRPRPTLRPVRRACRKRPPPDITNVFCIRATGALRHHGNAQRPLWCAPRRHMSRSSRYCRPSSTFTVGTTSVTTDGPDIVS